MDITQSERSRDYATRIEACTAEHVYPLIKTPILDSLIGDSEEKTVLG